MSTNLALICGCVVVAVFVLGVTLGHDAAERHAVQHSDCATAHNMRGGFYYIVPEKEYCRLVLCQYGENGVRRPEVRAADDRRG